MTKSILLVNADGLLRRSLAEQLVSHGFHVFEADSADAAFIRLATDEMNIVVADRQLPDMAAIPFCEELRRRDIACPIVFLGPTIEETSSFKAVGANACLAKPFRFANLLHLVETQLREQTSDVAMQFGCYRFHPVARLMVDEAGRRVRLTEKETAIIAYLHRAGTRVVPRDELLGEVWGYSNAASTHTVETHIYRLRRKLEAGFGAGPILCTENGGYRLAS